MVPASEVEVGVLLRQRHGPSMQSAEEGASENRRDILLSGLLEALQGLRRPSKRTLSGVSLCGVPLRRNTTIGVHSSLILSSFTILLATDLAHQGDEGARRSKKLLSTILDLAGLFPILVELPVGAPATSGGDLRSSFRWRRNCLLFLLLLCFVILLSFYFFSLLFQKDNKKRCYII